MSTKTKLEQFKKNWYMVGSFYKCLAISLREKARYKPFLIVVEKVSMNFYGNLAKT